MFDDDHAVDTHGGRFRWLVSTCIAGATGALAIFVIIAGSTENRGGGGGFMPALERLRDGATTPELIPRMKRSAGLKWAVPKTSRLEISAGLTSTRYVIHETVRQRREGRSYIHAQPYMRIVARLAPVPAESQDVIPPFNPFQLYADKNPIGARKGGKGKKREDVRIDVVELIGGVLPLEDRQSLDKREALELIEQFRLEETMAAAENEEGADGAGSDLFAPDEDESAFTSKLLKNEFEPELETPDLPGAQTTAVKVEAGQNLAALLTQQGAQKWQRERMLASMRRVFPASSLLVGDEVRFTLVPSLTDAGELEPAAFSIYSDTGAHRVTVSRNDAGDYRASLMEPKSIAGLRGSVGNKTSKPKSSSLYASVYHSALLQNVPQQTILKILRTNAYQTDFGRRVRPGDTIELFFGFQNENFSDGPPDELLFTEITSAGESARFYRFRTSDGEVDFYDEQGNNSKRFLTRKPVRGSNVRLSSGYGMRYHPLLNRRRMHAGVDWAGPTGTPILAAGRGVIELAGRKGQYGNYVRIRHANGYQTAYAHMHRFARGVRAGAKVRQGQIIGYIGSTGLSSGPHLHYEVLVNNRHVNPMKIKVPRERQLKGRELIEYQRERARIDELMRRAPVMTINK
ncbi:MAG: M23 family metallopeptidase [Alphaproteobacteria bacterium]|nr:M23 family metallopeptidase [Alphaproteobacteria bacterium]